MSLLRNVIILFGVLLAGCDDSGPCVGPVYMSQGARILTRSEFFPFQNDDPSKATYKIEWTQSPDFQNWTGENETLLSFNEEKPGTPSEINIGLSTLGSTGRGVIQIRFSDPGTTYTSANGVTYAVMKSTQVNYPTLPGGTTYFAAVMTETTMHPERFSAVATGAEEFSFEATYLRPFLYREGLIDDLRTNDRPCFTGLLP